MLSKNIKSLLKYAAILCIIIGIVLAVDYVFLHVLLPNKRMDQHPTLDVPFITNEQ